MKVTATVTADQTITQAINNNRTTRNIFVKKKRCEFIIWDGIYPDNYEIVKKGPLAMSANSILNMYSLFIKLDNLLWQLQSHLLNNLCIHIEQKLISLGTSLLFTTCCRSQPTPAAPFGSLFLFYGWIFNE